MLISKALLMTTNHKNLNGRIYPKEVVELAIQNPIIQEQLKNGGVFGTVVIPSCYDESMLEIDASKISHVVKKFFFEGDNLYGEVEILDTEEGRRIQELLLSNKNKPELALNGLGDGIVTKDGEFRIQEFDIISFNWVEKSSNIFYSVDDAQK